MRTKKFAGLFILALMTVFIFAVSSFADSYGYYIVDRDSPYHVSKWESIAANTTMYSVFPDYKSVNGSEYTWRKFNSNCFYFARWVTYRLKNVNFTLQVNGMQAISNITGTYKLLAQHFNEYSGYPSESTIRNAFNNVQEGDVIQMRGWSSKSQHTMVIAKKYSNGFTTLEGNRPNNTVRNYSITFSEFAKWIKAAGSVGGFSIYRFGADTVIRPSINNYPKDNPAIAGIPYSYQCTATGTNITWATDVTGSTYVLPELSINSSTGLISGTPSHTSSGKKSYLPISYTFSILASNSAGGSSRAGSIRVWEPPVITTSSTLPSGKQGVYYSQNIQAEGTEFTMTWKLKSGSLPPGLKFNGYNNKRIATISGTPTQPGTYVFTIELSNVVGQPETTTTKQFTIKIDGAEPPYDSSINITYTFKNGVRGQNYSDFVKVNIDKYSCFQNFGELPRGLDIVRSGKYIYLRGTLTISGTYNFALTIYKAVNNKITGQRSFSFTVSVTSPYSSEQRDSRMSTTWNYLPGKIGTSYYDYILVNGGTAPYGARVISGTAPTGLKFSTSGRYIYLSGVPRGQWKNFTFTLRIVGAHGGYVDKDCSINIAYNPAYPAGDDEEESLTKPKIITKSLADATINAEYSAILEATGATPITWTLVSSKLPEGVYFDEDEGKVSGIFTNAGTYSFKVKAENPAGSSTQSVKIKVLPEKPAIITESLPIAVLREEYNVALEADGTDLKWSKSGSFPSGLKLDSKNGIISGAAKKAGTYKFKITAKNKAGSDSREFTIEIDAGDPPSIDITSLPDGTVKTRYEATITASGSGTLKFSKSGTLPSGLKLNSKTGVISGTPKKAGTYNFSITVKNEAGSATKNFELVINNASGSRNNTLSTNNNESDLEIYDETSEPVITLEDDDSDEISGNSGSIQTALYLVSGDEKLENSVTVEAGKDLIFEIGEWVNASGIITEVSDVKIFIDSQEISGDIIISDDETFTLPGELVTGEFTVYAKSSAGSLELKTQEINIIADSENKESGMIISVSSNSGQANNKSGGCNMGFAGIVLFALCGTMIFKKK